jgi:signal peptidase I
MSNTAKTEIKPDAKKTARSADKIVAPAAKGKAREWLDALIFAGVMALILRTFVIEAFRIPTGSMEDTLLVGDFLLVNKFVYGASVPFTDLRLPAVKKVQQGDIVVFKYPRDPAVNYIKRCIGVAGDKLEIKDKRPFINGVEFPLPPKGKFSESQLHPAGAAEFGIFPQFGSFNKDNYGPIRVPKKGDVVQLGEDTYNLYADVIRYEGHTPSLMGGKVLIDNLPQTTYTIGQDYYFMMGDNRDNSSDSRYWGFMPESNLLGSALVIYWSWDPDVSFLDPIGKVASIRWSRIANIIR